MDEANNIMPNAHTNKHSEPILLFFSLQFIFFFVIIRFRCRSTIWSCPFESEANQEEFALNMLCIDICKFLHVVIKIKIEPIFLQYLWNVYFWNFLSLLLDSFFLFSRQHWPTEKRWTDFCAHSHTLQALNWIALDFILVTVSVCGVIVIDICTVQHFFSAAIWSIRHQTECIEMFVCLCSRL